MNRPYGAKMRPSFLGDEISARPRRDQGSGTFPKSRHAAHPLSSALEPVLEENDPLVDHDLLEGRRELEEALRLLLGGEAHHALDAGAVVPAAVPDHDLTRRRDVGHVPFQVHLALLALGRRGQRDDPKHARAHPLGDRLDRPALAGTVAALEEDADLEPLVLDPFLQLTSSTCSLARCFSYSLRPSVSGVVFRRSPSCDASLVMTSRSSSRAGFSGRPGAPPPRRRPRARRRSARGETPRSRRARTETGYSGRGVRRGRAVRPARGAADSPART